MKLLTVLWLILLHIKIDNKTKNPIKPCVRSDPHPAPLTLNSSIIPQWEASLPGRSNDYVGGAMTTRAGQ